MEPRAQDVHSKPAMQDRLVLTQHDDEWACTRLRDTAAAGVQGPSVAGAPHSGRDPATRSLQRVAAAFCKPFVKSARISSDQNVSAHRTDAFTVYGGQPSTMCEIRAGFGFSVNGMPAGERAAGWDAFRSRLVRGRQVVRLTRAPEDSE